MMIIKLWKEWLHLRGLKQKANGIKMRRASEAQRSADEKANPLYILKLTPHENYQLMEREFWPIPSMFGSGYYSYSPTLRFFDTKEEGQAAIKRLTEEQ